MPEFDINTDNTAENTIIELNTMDEETGALSSSEIKEISDTELKVMQKKRKDRKSRKKFSFRELTKKQKIIFIASIVVIILIITGLLLYFLVFKKGKEEDKKPVDNVVIEKDNYIYNNGELELLNQDGEKIGKYNCKDKDSKKCYVAMLSSEDNFDTAKYVNSKNEPILRTSKIYNDKYVFIFDDDKIALYDIKKEDISGEYELIKASSQVNDLVVVKDKDHKYGIIKFDIGGPTTLIDNSFEYLGIIDSSETFVAKEGGLSYLVDTKGASLTTKLKGEIKSFSPKYVAVYNDGYIVYNYSGLSAIDEDIDFVEFKDNYIFTITDGRMYVYDDTLFKLGENGIRIKNNDYLPTYVFNENNSLKDTKRAYTITISEDKIDIELSDKSTKSINLYEASLSKKTPYINYIDGSLYIYADEGKQDLLGTYSCANKNNVKKNDTEFKNCFVAKNTNILSKDKEDGYIPIIGNQYIFINDVKEGSSASNIVLYDLKAKNNLAKYQNVDTSQRLKSVGHIASMSDIIAAQNTDGNYGVIGISNTGPQGLVAFKDTKKITYFKAKYIMAQRDKYYLYAIDDLKTEVTSSNYEIIDYSDGNLLVKDDKYILYSKDGKVLKNDWDYGFLEKDFAIGIKNKGINLYRYDDGEAILAEDVKLITEDSKYENFKVKADSSYIIEVLKEDGSYEIHEFSLGGQKIDEKE